ncbi:MAG: hypothetical protein E7613_01700 [Ruminococcaceae bacterium]|nr:hypothetical protein [Oscillospiraceae bacterium]
MFIIDWWNSLSLASQIFSCIAFPSTLLLIIQTVSMLMGFDSDGDVTDGAEVDLDPDIDDVSADINGLDGLRIFTVRGIVAFLVVFGWVGIVLDSSGVALSITALIAAASGFLIMFLLAYLLRAVMKLRSDGNIDNRNAVGRSGKVYLTVPPKRSGEGKIQILFQSTYSEISAVTDEEEPITTGAEVIVTGLSGETTLVVKRK